MTKNQKYEPFSEAAIKRNRIFPTAKAVGFFVLVAIQILCMIFALHYAPQPQDRIDRYEITASPNADGTVDMTYRFVWTALDTSEDLTWIEIGMPNKYFTCYEESFSSNIASFSKYTDGAYASLWLDLDRPYQGGETVELSFRVKQERLLCGDGEGCFFEFVPGWFNSTPVESYRFTWKADPEVLSSNADSLENGFYVWEGSMPCGTYVSMQVLYDGAAFSGAQRVQYEPFYDGDVIDELENDKIAVIVFAVILCLCLLIAQIYMVDSVVSYHRGRGFLSGYGHRVHLYGRTNPRYAKERDKHTAAHSGGRSGGGRGCACACACACAGGGRAGCSQKDTHPFPLEKADK